ncbi:hypothetical protein HYC85_030706 [Camellia sinensis]|uniref:Serine-threonine/tyrosine-protein kinase catalytic domain-containing protein n=1 Tax=Camellia sinensis TaxID=4442 RepID=A0A7J7G2J2_CAMSI|nr:hypothetical protein HYC85_030706 [Camellia sinensis]
MKHKTSFQSFRNRASRSSVAFDARADRFGVQKFNIRQDNYEVKTVVEEAHWGQFNSEIITLLHFFHSRSSHFNGGCSSNLSHLRISDFLTFVQRFLISCLLAELLDIVPKVFSRHFGRVSHKADVYSYGILVLKMVRGKENIGQSIEDTSDLSFPHSIYKKLECDRDIGLHGIESEEDEKVAQNMILVGLCCIQANPSERLAINKNLSRDLRSSAQQPTRAASAKYARDQKLLEPGIFRSSGGMSAGADRQLGMHFCILLRGRCPSTPTWRCPGPAKGRCPLDPRELTGQLDPRHNQRSGNLESFIITNFSERHNSGWIRI